MAILTLDLGTNTGWCVHAGGANASGTWDFKGRRHEGGGMRYLRFRGALRELHVNTPIKYVAYEEVRRHAGTDAAHVYGGLLAVLTAWCEEYGVAYVGIPVGTIKKFATGKGNADKAAMVAAARGWGFAPGDDNEADAIALMMLQLEAPEVQALV